MIEKGQTITCPACKKEVYRAREDISYGANMASKYLEYMDGAPVKKYTKMACPNCWIIYRSISTKNRELILVGQME